MPRVLVGNWEARGHLSNCFCCNEMGVVAAPFPSVWVFKVAAGMVLLPGHLSECLQHHNGGHQHAARVSLLAARKPGGNQLPFLEHATASQI